MNNNQYETLSEATEDLRRKGYDVNFEVTEECKMTDHNGHLYDASEVILNEFHRFEGITNPADSTILYAVETKTGLKGQVIDSYGVYASNEVSDFMNKTEQKQY